MKTYGDYLWAVIKGLPLKCVPEEHKSYELCLEALMNNQENIKYIPKQLKEKIKNETSNEI
jgi:hypothetical protein